MSGRSKAALSIYGSALTVGTRQRLLYAVLLLFFVTGFGVQAAQVTAVRVAVLGIELVAGDLSGAVAPTPQEQRRRKETAQLIRELLAADGYGVVDQTETEEAISDAQVSEFLHMCNGCELDLGRALSVDWVVVAWVQRVSNLILNLNVVVRRVSDGRTIAQAFVDMRGNTDKAWLRAARYAFENSLRDQLGARL